MTNRFDGYNRQDYHFSRTSQEAFGHGLTAKDFEPEDGGGVVARRFMIAVLVIVALFMLSGWK